ncbi:MAG TPA: phosphate ABC transporter permease subunit PstC [Dehalococcoidia bacterium]|nr:phosphate ABC transporter permease subunit PstC [Dehalococcoidia bacterium]
MALETATPAAPLRLRGGRARALREGAIHLALLLCAAVSIVTTAGIVFVLAFEAFEFFREVSLRDFLTDTQWTPLFTDAHYGIAPLLAGTMLTSIGAMFVAGPLGLLAGIYLSEYASDRARAVLKPALEVLAGVPTVVYGYFALLFVTPILQDIYGGIAVFNGLSASLVMGVMILPLVSSLTDDAMSAVPRSLREGAYALGSTKYEVATRVVAPAALSGILAALVLAISRAVGETMIVAIAAGQSPTLTWSPFVPIETMTAFIVQVSLGDTPAGSLAFRTIFAVGAALFVITLVMNLLSRYVVMRFREEYE